MQQTLYHAMNFTNLKLFLERNSFRGYSTHRIHKNGTVPWPIRSTGAIAESKEYKESDWYFGVCLTRSRAFARGWGDIVFYLNLDVIRHNYKVVPYNWMETRVKAEFEEFLITSPAGFNQSQADRQNWCPDTQEAEYDQAVANCKLLCEGYKGEIFNAHRFIRKIEIAVDSKFKNRYPVPRSTQIDMMFYDLKRYHLVHPDLFAYCEQHQIELTVA